MTTAESALEDMDASLTRHFYTGKGWIGYTLVIPREYASLIVETAKKKKLRMLQHIAVKFDPKGRAGKISINLEGKIIGGGIRKLDIPVRAVDTLTVAKIVKDEDVGSFMNELPTLPTVTGNDIDPELLAIAEMRNIDITGKTRSEIIDLIGA